MRFSAIRTLGSPRALAWFAVLAGPVLLAPLAVLEVPAGSASAAVHAGRGGQLLAGPAPPVPVPPHPGRRAASRGRTADAAPLAVALAGLAASAVALWWRDRQRAAPAGGWELRVESSPAAAGNVAAGCAAAEGLAAVNAGVGSVGAAWGSALAGAGAAARQAVAEVGAVKRETLASAVAAGSAALAGAGDSRQAIITCHTAMEEALVASRSWRAADSLEKLLRRAAADRALQTPAALLLAGLFREARFSPREFADDDREKARAALAEIGAELAGNR
jgi:hypothetical protein